MNVCACLCCLLQPADRAVLPDDDTTLKDAGVKGRHVADQHIKPCTTVGMKCYHTVYIAHTHVVTLSDWFCRYMLQCIACPPPSQWQCPACTFVQDLTSNDCECVVAHFTTQHDTNTMCDIHDHACILVCFFFFLFFFLSECVALDARMTQPCCHHRHHRRPSSHTLWRNRVAELASTTLKLLDCVLSTHHGGFMYPRPAV